MDDGSGEWSKLKRQWADKKVETQYKVEMRLGSTKQENVLDSHVAILMWGTLSHLSSSVAISQHHNLIYK